MAINTYCRSIGSWHGDFQMTLALSFNAPISPAFVLLFLQRVVPSYYQKWFSLLFAQTPSLEMISNVLARGLDSWIP